MSAVEEWSKTGGGIQTFCYKVDLTISHGLYWGQLYSPDPARDVMLIIIGPITLIAC